MSIAYEELETFDDELVREGRIPASSAPRMAYLRALRLFPTPMQRLLEIAVVVGAILSPFASVTLALSLGIEAFDATILVASLNPQTQLAIHRRGVHIATLSDQVRQVRLTPGTYVLRTIPPESACTDSQLLTHRLSLAPGEQHWVTIP